MLKPDQAKAALEKVHVQDWRDRCLDRAGKLPRGLRALGRLLLDRDPEGEEFAGWDERNRAWAAAGKQLDKLTANGRVQLFAVVFPKVAPFVEAGWQLKHRLPYQDRYDRKAFRAPSTPPATRSARRNWLSELAEELGGYEQDITWFAAWAPHLGGFGGADALGVLLAAAIDSGEPEGDAVFDILCESARGEHDIGGMGRHVTRALLVASRPDGWEFMEKMLLAAQRQEGLRQVILETIDESHPEAFRRMLRLIREHDLARFSSVVRALDVWFGYHWDSVSTRVVDSVVERVTKFLEGPASRKEALDSDDAETSYLALWAMAFEDAPAAVRPAARLLKDPDVERRFVGVHLLGQLALPAARRELLAAVDDEDLRVALHALECARGDFDDEEDNAREKTDLFERVERLMSRLPEKRAHLDPIVWPWHTFTADRSNVSHDLLSCIGDRPPTRLIPYLPVLGTYQRSQVVDRLAEMKRWDAATRETLFALVGDTSGTVRESAVKALAKGKITAEEARQLEDLLTRKAADLRRGVLQLLLSLKDADALASADRLLASSQVPQRLAGLEMLRQLVEGKRAGDQCRARAEKYRTQRSKRLEEETKQLGSILDTGRKVATLDDALGLMDPVDRTPPQPPKARKVDFFTEAAVGCLKELDALVDRHRETAIPVETWEGPKEELLGNLSYGFPSPDTDKDPKEDAARLPLREVWETWWTERPKKLRDRDGLELLRAWMWQSVDQDAWEDWNKKKGPAFRKAFQAITGGQRIPALKYDPVVGGIIRWLLRLHPPAGAAAYLLDAVEASFALVPPEERLRVPKTDQWWDDDTWRADDSFFLQALQAARNYRDLCTAEWQLADHARLFRLLRWLDEPGPGVPRVRPQLIEVLRAHRAGVATEADLLDLLLGPRRPEPYTTFEFEELQTVTAQRPDKVLEREPLVRALADRCRERILEIELERGETPTAASSPALSVASLQGLDVLVRLLRALGKSSFSHAHYGNLGKSAVLTHLVRVTYPAEADTPQIFAERLKAEAIPQQRLIDLAFLGPQWVRHVEAYLGWPQFAEGVWWFIAHARDGSAGEDTDACQALIRERTPLTQEELNEGAVDVAWFRRVYDALGPKRWPALNESSKYASWGRGYKRAQFLSDVLLGKAKKTALIADIKNKNSREAVRALGLLPLAAGKERDKDLHTRYRVLHDYLRYAKKLGPMSREGALRTAGIGMANLARTAGYPDPLRFEWAMETEFVADLARGPVTVSNQGVDVALAITTEGEPELTAARDGKPLKSIPPPVKQHAKVKELSERKTELKRQSSRMRQSLEQTMCRGDTFTGSELRQLFEHPLLAPQLERLVLVGEGIMGYPVSGGKVLRDHAGKAEPVQKDEALRLAHPHDLLQGKDWHRWQHDCFAAERVQPFKQVFRELYVLTATEKADGTISRRYAGQQINPRQASALWASRGWTVSEQEGVRRTFHDAGLTAWVTFLGGYFTPAEVEGLTIEGVQFAKKGEWEPIPLAKVSPRLFSEVMRDLDLVVSVAHRGGVDPEASASTVEMRAALLRETCDLLNLGNVRIKDAHVLIGGQLANYTVHLGSGVVHRQPGGHLCLVPVHGQHRGRLFLPFADDDPKTAEVISKVLLLARDHEIQDPNILDQIRVAR